MWQRIYRERGQELPREQWLSIIGTASGPFDPLIDLGQRTGIPLDADELNRLERAYYREATVAQALLPGVGRYLDDARALGLKTAIASSSSREWVREHLERFGIANRFDTVVCKDDVTRTKPDPELSRAALDRMGVRSEDAIALEDSTAAVQPSSSSKPIWKRRVAWWSSRACCATSSSLRALRVTKSQSIRTVWIRRNFGRTSTRARSEGATTFKRMRWWWGSPGRSVCGTVFRRSRKQSIG